MLIYNGYFAKNRKNFLVNLSDKCRCVTFIPNFNSFYNQIDNYLVSVIKHMDPTHILNLLDNDVVTCSILLDYICIMNNLS